MTFQSLQGNEAFAQKDGDLEVFWNGGTTPGFPLEFQGETGLLLRCVGNIGIPLQMNQGIGPSSRDEEGKPGLFLSCRGKLGVPLAWTGILGTSELHQGCQVPFRVSRGNVGFFSRHCSGKGPHLVVRENLVVFLE